MLESALMGAAIGVGVMLVMLFWGARRKFDFVAKRPSRGQSFAVALSPEMAATALQKIAEGYQQHEVKPGLVVLKDKMTATAYSYYYPIYLAPKDGGTEVFVAIQPKMPQYGPVVKNKLNKAVAAAKQALGA